MTQRVPKKSQAAPQNGAGQRAPSAPPPSATYPARNLLKTSPKRPVAAKALSRASESAGGAPPPPTRTKVRPTMSPKSTNTQPRREEEYTEDSPEQTAVRA